MQIGTNVRERLSHNFSLQEGGQQHFFSLEPGQAESQLVVRPDSRIIAAFPADNTGVSLWFEPGASVSALAPPTSRSGDGRQELEVELRSHNSTLGVSEAIMGSIRTIREKLQDTGELDRVRRESAAFAEATGARGSWVAEEAQVSPGQLRFLRTELDGRPYEATLSVPPEVSITPGPTGIQLKAPGPFDFRLRVALPREPLGGYAPEELFSPSALDLADKLAEQGDPRAERCLSSMQSLMFLARQDKFMAGSWRFMTYFGRDTMLSLMLLQPAITRQAYANGLQSAYSQDPVHHRDLDRQGYHGAVVWSWQSAMMQAGLARQQERYPELAPRLKAAIARLQKAEQQAGPLATSELWTHEVVEGEWKAAPWGGQAAAGGDESNAAQLWSTVYPAVLMRTG